MLLYWHKALSLSLVILPLFLLAHGIPNMLLHFGKSANFDKKMYSHGKKSKGTHYISKLSIIPSQYVVLLAQNTTNWP